ncbi:MAG: RpiB/LacA/LacB family sugar-phosphate isomerase [Bacteroidia bacterium]|nr:RpiB/LacA/LacB family sugar-phosphate isomerase [Bacteroidia bacterium]
MKRKIAIANDHAGTDYKFHVMKALEAQCEFTNFGTDETESVDYPDFVHPLAQAVESGDCELGILICGSGNGVCMTANKHQDIRAALCWNAELGSLARQHNNANVVCIPARFITQETAMEVIEAFLTADFEGGRHERRVSKISC